jgi:hypothetical protein
MTGLSHEVKCTWRTVDRKPMGTPWGRHYDIAEMPPDTICQCKPCLDARTPTITLYSGAKLVEWTPAAARFAIMSEGTVVIGDPHTVLHQDIMQAPTNLGFGETLLLGVLLHHRGDRWDIAYLQPLKMRTDEAGMRLLSRLTTWAEFREGCVLTLLDQEERLRRFAEDVRRDNLNRNG